MRGPTEPSSVMPPARAIGERIHVDLIPIDTSIGGNKFILLKVDAKSAYDMGVPLQAKSVPHLKIAFEKAFSCFRA
jgi:hypothetical protein